MTAEPRVPLQKIVDQLPDPVCAVDADGRYVFVNAACERLFGYSREELIGRNMIELVFPEDRERTLQAAGNVMRGQSHLHFENRYVRKDGQVVHIMWSARWSETERVRLAVARDVTALKRAESVQRALYQISEAADVAEGLSGLCARIQQIIGELLPAENFYVALYDETTDSVSFPCLVDERDDEAPRQRLMASTPLAEIIHRGAPLLTSDNQTAGKTVHWLGMPLISKKGVIGALVLRRYDAGAPYSEEDQDRLRLVATQVAAAVERKQNEARLRHLAGHDSLTDLPNRMLFNDRFDTALKRARRYGEHLALLYIDLNGFKDVNDSFGHEFGDLLLREVAKRIAGCLRESDTVGRMGGDEFTVLLAHIQNAQDVDRVAAKLHAAITAPFQVDGRTVEISASIGTAVYPEQGGDREQLFRHADARMYAEKRRCG